MNRAVFTLLCFLFVVIPQVPAGAQGKPGIKDGFGLLKPLQAVERFSLTGEMHNQEYVLDLDYGFVLGMLAGMHDLSQISLAAKRAPFYCPPEGANAGQEALIVLKYLRSHPEQLHLPASVLIIKSLGQAFPCGRKGVHQR